MIEVWKTIVGMRSKVVHDYLNVDEDIVWDTVTNELPSLIEQLERILNSDEGRANRPFLLQFSPIANKSSKLRLCAIALSSILKNTGFPVDRLKVWKR